MCEFCSVGTQYLVYEETKRSFGRQTCSDHISQAIAKVTEYLSNSKALIIVERVDN